MVSSCSSREVVDKNKSTQGSRSFSPREPCGVKGFNVSYNGVGSTHQVSKAAGKAKRGESGKPAAVRRDGRLYVK